MRMLALLLTGLLLACGDSRSVGSDDGGPGGADGESAGDSGPDQVALDFVPLPPPDQCDPPSYTSDCSTVSHFDCGVEITCTGSEIFVEWHEHVDCGGGVEQFGLYTCRYTCPGT